LRAPKDAPALFELVARSVWLVLAAQSLSDVKRLGDVALGSAVAVTTRQLFTNCHVVENRPLVIIMQEEITKQARVFAGDADTDRCILVVDQPALVPVPGVRKYDELRVGETVFTIGSPSGLERTLGQGIVSGLRRLNDQRLVQTTAQISPGSSGGGLFDQSGNLIGITTFSVRDSEGLNFAIAAEDYSR